MGKSVTPENRKEQREERRTLPARKLAALLAVGFFAIGGMALLNGNAKPNRDMQWYMKPEAVEVAAPPMGEGYAVAEAGAVGGALPLGDAEPAPVAADVGEDAGTVEAVTEITDDDLADPTQVADPDEAQAASTREIDETATGSGAEEEADNTEAEDSESLASAAIEPSDEGLTSALADRTPEGDEADDEEEIPSGPVTITITAAGDCTFGGEIGAKGRRRFVQYAKDYGYDYFFEGVRSIFENDDLTLVNLEGPLTNVTKPGKRDGFIFKGDPEYVNILTGSSVELCNVANNHSRDYGTAGLKETAEVLDEADVGYCGYTKAYYTKIKGVRVGALGFTWWDGDKDSITKAVAEARENCDLLIVSMHWGLEYKYDQGDKQEMLGRAIVDAGADLVIGTHPHVFQGIERYKGKYIVYSLGNFCFAGNANPADKRCLIFQQSFSFTPGMGIAQAGILDEGINIIPTYISSVKDKNDFQPTVMGAEDGAKLLKSIARHSRGFTFEDTLWMKDNYMAQNGLLPGETGEVEEDEEADKPQV